MSKEYVTLSKSGRVVIPKHIRKQLGLLGEGDVLLKITAKDNTIILENAFWFDSEDAQAIKELRKYGAKRLPRDPRFRATNQWLLANFGPAPVPKRRTGRASVKRKHREAAT
jgi:AbrB family looped-hinge helix DNA binding protein